MTKEVKRKAVATLLNAARQMLSAVQTLCHCEPECREDDLTADKVRKALNNLKK